jgi:hypothetical protein
VGLEEVILVHPQVVVLVILKVQWVVPVAAEELVLMEMP